MKRLLVLLTLTVLLLCSCAATDTKESYFGMGSAVTVTTIQGDCGAECLQAVKSLEETLKPSDGVFDLTNPDILTAAKLCKELSEMTDGAFDVYIGRLTELWNFDTDTPAVPSDDSITNALAYVGDYTVSGGVITANGDNYFDFGSVGKGFACDKACAVLRNNGKNGLVAVGGSLGAVGTKQDGTPFRIGIRDPYSANAVEYMAILELTDRYVSTSGSYEKYFDYDGKKYHHILNAKDGYPVDNGLISVTVVADNGLLTDALTTACFCIGEAKALEILSHYGCEGVIVATDHITVTEGLRDIITFTKAGVRVQYV